VTLDAGPSIDREHAGHDGGPEVPLRATNAPANGGGGGGPVVFERVFQDHAPYVWRALRRLGVAEADADDVCQDVFIVVHRRLGSFHGGSSLRTWLYGICLRVASEHRRRPHHRRERVVSAVPDESVGPSQEDELERRRGIALLDAALDQLDDDKRAVFVLFEFEQVPMVEVAQAAGCPLQTAYSRLHAARRIVEAALAHARHAPRSKP
jgi:RNA polymerase sigma-70 factor (ECF subfamily)